MSEASVTPEDWTIFTLIWGWHTDGVHPDRVVRWLEGGTIDGVFDLRDEDMTGTRLYENGERVPLPGWYRLLPAVIGGMDPHAPAESAPEAGS